MLFCIQMKNLKQNYLKNTDHRFVFILTANGLGAGPGNTFCTHIFSHITTCQHTWSMLGNKFFFVAAQTLEDCILAAQLCKKLRL